MKTCFSIMPFGTHFDDISEIVRDAAANAGLEYVRSDLEKRPGNIMAQILYEIQRAAVVVADITGHNPNVFYELGIAHHIAGPERVVIITQSVDPNKAFDVHQYRQLVYAHNNDGRARLSMELGGRLQEAKEESANREFWNVTRGRLPRTLMIVRDLQRIIHNAGSKGLEGKTIRVFASLSSLSISNEEPSDPKLGAEYRDALRAERDSLRQALLLGAHLRAVLNPPRHFAHVMLPDRLTARYRRLIALLESKNDVARGANAEDAQVVANCEFVLSPVPMPNLFIIGREVAYEGMKRSGAGGFDMTHCETGPQELDEMTEQFDRIFEESRSEMRRTHPPDGRVLEQLKAFFCEAAPGEQICNQES